MNATRARLADGRWHFQHGPIDLVIAADGARDAVAAAHEAAWRRFTTVLEELVAELPVLRRPVGGFVPGDGATSDAGRGGVACADACPLHGDIARRMWHACRPHAGRFVTPMAAVAGAIADTIVAAYRRPGVRRAWVNNGGDIALHLTAGTSVDVGLFADLARDAGPDGTLALDGRFAIAHDAPVRGIATSGWRGRSFSLGIADSVTVLAADAATADAAATMIANAVDVDDARIVRRPASSLKDDSDLGDRLVTVDVPLLGVDAVRRALAAGRAHAEALRAAGRIEACALFCQGEAVTVRGDGRWHAPRFEHRMPEAA